MATAQVIEINSTAGIEEALSLFDYYALVEGDIEITNVSNESIFLTITSIRTEVPESWDNDESDFTQFFVEDLQLAPAEEYSNRTGSLVQVNEYTDITAFNQVIKVTAKDELGNVLEEKQHELLYEIYAADLVSPTFRILDQNFIELADTIYFPVEVGDPFSREFLSQININMNDEWNLERPITWEPQEIILENIEVLECWHDDPFSLEPDKSWCKGDTVNWISTLISFAELSGTLGQSNDYRIEILVHVYDKEDSLNSSQTIRFIGADADCINGTQVDLVINPERSVYLCPGSDLSLMARVGFPNITWRDQSNNTTTTGSSFMLTDIQENTSIYITSRDENGCLFYDHFDIYIEERYEQFIETPSGEDYIESCAGQAITMTAISGYDDVIWFNELTGETFFGPELTYTPLLEEAYFQVKAIANDGCTVFQYINIYVNPDGVYERIIDIDDWISICVGGILQLEAPLDYGNVMWLVESTGQIYTGNEVIIENILEYTTIQITADSELSGCAVYQQFTVQPEYNNSDELVDGSDFPVCSGSSITITANDGFNDIQWLVLNTSTEESGPSLTLSNISNYIEIMVTGRAQDGCLTSQYISVYPEDEEIYDENVLASPILETCRILTLQASSAYTDIEWHVHNYRNNEYEITFGNSIDLDYSEFLEIDNAYLMLKGRNADGCLVFQEIEIPFKQAEETQLIDLSNLDNDCNWTELSLSTISSYEVYRWEYKGTYSNDPMQIIQNDGSEVRLLVVDDSGCVFRDSYYPSDNYISAPELCVVTSDELTSQNTILWEDPMVNAGSIVYYKILREGNISNEFDSIGRVEFAEKNRFEDTEADNRQQAYRYQVVGIDKCGKESTLSNIHKTIHLTINLGTSNNINLIWDQYNGISYAQVRILRGTSANNLEEFIVLPSTVISFTDQNPPNGDVFYQIEIPTIVDCVIQRVPLTIKSNVAGIMYDSTNEEKNNINIYPNPVKDILTVETGAKGQVQLLDNTGRIHNIMEVKNGSNNLDVSTLANGLYFIRWYQGEKVSLSKFIKL